LFFEAPTIPEKEVKPKVCKKFDKEVKPRKKVYDQDKKASQPSGAQAWEKEKRPWYGQTLEKEARGCS